jgi:hypothetical protein
VNRAKLTPTDRNNPTDEQIFDPLGCFYPLEKLALFVDDFDSKILS